MVILCYTEGGASDSDCVETKEESLMMYPFLTLDDGAEIVHSDMGPDGCVKVYI